MTLDEPQRLEWRQFRLLSRDATRRLLSTALFSRDSDPVGFALWMLALLTTPPLLFGVARGMNYVFLRRVSTEVLERTVLADRLFFVIYGMLAAVLLASLLWEALFPDRAEQEIVGVLPVRARTLAAARLAAAIRLGAICALAVTVPAAAAFTLMAASHPALRSMHTIFAGHVLGVTLACLFVFLTFLSLRGVMAVTMGTRAGSWLAIALQLLAIVSLVEVFFFLPRVLEGLVRVVRDEGQALWLPPLWFAALFSWTAGDQLEPHPELGGLAIIATVFVTGLAAALYVMTAAGVGRRVMEAQERHRQNRLTTLASGIARIASRRPCIRSIFLFTVASLARSRQHLLILSAYVSLALAAIIFRLVAAGMHRPQRPGPRVANAAPERVQYAMAQVFADEPTAAQLSVALVLIFFLVLGLRACFRVPTDAEANWPFRLLPPSAADAAAGTWLSLLVMGVAPIAVLTVVAGLALWSVTTAVAACAVTLATGALLVEIVVIEWSIVPFTCAHEPSADTVRWKWMAGFVALNVFGFGLAAVEAGALSSARGTAWYLAVMASGIFIARVRRRRLLGKRDMTFEEPPDQAATLRLSEALN